MLRLSQNSIKDDTVITKIELNNIIVDLVRKNITARLDNLHILPLQDDVFDIQ